MKLYKIHSNSVTFYHLDCWIWEAHLFAKKALGPGVSFSVKEASDREFQLWLNDPLTMEVDIP